MEVTPLTGALGAEIRGVDLRNAPESLIAELRDVLARFHVLAVRDQQLSASELSQLAQRFGPFSGNPIHVPLEGQEDIVKMVREADDDGPNLGGTWHMDLAWFKAPPGLTLLYAEETPPVGGDTLFADLTAAWAALSPTMRACLERLVGVHSGQGVYATNAAARAISVQADAMAASQVETEHPLVCRHAATDEPHLLINGTIRCFKGMTEDESRSIVRFLLEHAVRPEFTCRLRWYDGTLGMWENPCLLHHAVDDYAGHRRVMYRTTVAGERPRPAVEAVDALAASASR